MCVIIIKKKLKINVVMKRSKVLVLYMVLLSTLMVDSYGSDKLFPSGKKHLPKAEQERGRKRGVSPEAREMYEFIKGKKFRAKVFSQNKDYSVMDQYETLTFHPVNETEGDVHSLVEWKEWGFAGESKGIVAKNTTFYNIREDGKIVFNSCILQKSHNDLVSNLKDSEGYKIIYHSR